MALSNHIYMNYRLMKEKAGQLEDLADELKQVTQNRVACYSRDTSFWKGDSANVCRQKLIKLQNDMNKREKELRRAAQSLRSIAEFQYRVEMALVSLVEK